MTDEEKAALHISESDLLRAIYLEQVKTNELLTELAEMTRSAYAIFNTPLGRLAARSGGNGKLNMRKR